MIYNVPLNMVDKMAEASKEAFIANNDPIGNYIFGTEPDHLNLKKRFFRSLVASCSPRSLRQAISPHMEAVSIWFPPGMDHSEDKENDLFTEKDFTDKMTMKRLEYVGEIIKVLTANLGDEPQWYLHLVAVRPGFTNRKYASTLVRPILNMAKEEGLPCTLITQTAENVRKYESWGFKVTQIMEVPQSNEKFYSMRKD